MIYIYGGNLYTFLGNEAKRGKEMSDINIIEDVGILVAEKIIAVGKRQDIETQYIKEISEAIKIDATNKTILPGLIDCHTHFIFGGYRAEEFSWRLKGDSYLSIMERGGGINASVKATREASFNDLYESGYSRLEKMKKMGITTVESKSGYGLDRDSELKMLEVMKKLNEDHPLDLINTFMAAHSVLPEYKGKEKQFLKEMLEVAKEVKEKDLAYFIDIFTEKGVFSVEDSYFYLAEAKKLGYKLKAHVDEMSEGFGGCEMAVEVGCVSADHLLKVSEKGIEKLSKSDTVATLLPLTAFCLAEEYAPARKLIDSDCVVALASDYNPGSCHCNSIPLLIALACIYMKMDIKEVICALTINAANAICRQEAIGTIEKGKQADIVIMDCPSIDYLVYGTANNYCQTVIKKGEVIYRG